MERQIAAHRDELVTIVRPAVLYGLNPHALEFPVQPQPGQTEMDDRVSVKADPDAMITLVHLGEEASGGLR
jgi:hypothetical protein